MSGKADKKIKVKEELDHLVAATNYSLSGIDMASRETSVRHEIILGFLHFTAVVFMPFTFETKLVLTVVWFFVVVTELLNTAVESVVDIASPERRLLAKRAKDVASAAVFTALVCFGLSWAAALAHWAYVRFFAELMN